MSHPTATSLRLPAAYGTPSRLLEWADVRDRLTRAPHYWLATTRPDARPHVVVVDGLWIDDRWYFGGAPQTVSQRNLRTNADIAVHLPDADRVIIAEGRAVRHKPSAAQARELAVASTAKYGFAPPQSAYRSGVWTLLPRCVLAWNSLSEDATRFDF